MTPIFRYNAHRQVLVEQARMKRPQNFSATLEHRLEVYNAHIADLREYPVAPGYWKEEVDYVEGKDFTIETDAHPDWRPSYNNPDDPPTITFACLKLYTRSELLAEVDKAWDECAKTYEDGILQVVPYKQKYFKHRYGVDL